MNLKLKITISQFKEDENCVQFDYSYYFEKDEKFIDIVIKLSYNNNKMYKMVNLRIENSFQQ